MFPARQRLGVLGGAGTPTARHVPALAPAPRSCRKEALHTAWPKVVAFTLLALPLAWLLSNVVREIATPGAALGPEPGEAVVHELGTWALRTLLLTLLISSIARIARQPSLIRFRRMAGLWAFAYVVLHFTAYLALLAGFHLDTILGDFTKRPYITMGLAALLMLIPLAITSTRGWQRRLGRRWRQLHRLVYLVALAAWIHLLWLSKVSYLDAVIYGTLLAALFGERIVDAVRPTRRAKAGT